METEFFFTAVARLAHGFNSIHMAVNVSNDLLDWSSWHHLMKTTCLLINWGCSRSHSQSGKIITYELKNVGMMGIQVWENSL